MLIMLSKNKNTGIYLPAVLRMGIIQLSKLLFVLMPFLIFSCTSKNNRTTGQTLLPHEKIDTVFAGSKKCSSCHKKEYEEWLGSAHQMSMQKADSNYVEGDFNNTEFISKGIKYLFFKRNRDYYVNTQGRDGKYHNYKIDYTFGYYPLQQYIVPFPKGKYQCLHSAWDVTNSKWFDLQKDLDVEPGDWMHWTGGSMTWNNMCADCHSTYVKKNYNPENDSYNTTFKEINVGCEACHGPAAGHIRYYENPPSDTAAFPPPRLYMPKNMAPGETVQKCARCHSRRSMVTNVFDYNGHYLDYYIPQLIRYPVYEKDGQIADEDYVYGSFMQSRMYNRENVSCKDCHNMHTMKLKKDGNALCLECHDKKYDTYSHHFHKSGTEASLCVNCHMTGRIYMGVDFRRDHSFRVPRPDQTVKYGTSNACNNCHKDKSPQWASDFIIKKYGKKRPLHFSDWLLPGVEGNNDSLKSLIRNPLFPAIIRATAVNILGERLTDTADVNLIIRMLNDSSALVRREAVLVLVNTGRGFENAVDKRLSDSIRTVRIAAARYFIMNGIDTQHKDFAKAKQEFLNYLKTNADFASGQHQLALYYMAQGDKEAAIRAYRRALEIDDHFNMARMNLALMEYQKGNVKEAERLYQKVIEQESGYSYPYFMLGLLYNEQGDAKESLKYLELASEKQPFISRAYYNYALKLQQEGYMEKAKKVIKEGLEKNPGDKNLLYLQSNVQDK